MGKRAKPRLPPAARCKLGCVEILSLFGKSDFGPAVHALIEKIAGGASKFYAPIDTIFHAWAGVQADKIKAVGEIETESVRRRAIERLLAEEARKQRNLEAIYGKTFSLLDPSTEPETILDEDWIFLHSENARLISDQDMQSLWARILAREAEKPGSFSKRTLEFLATLEKSEAEDFTNLCRYVVEITGRIVPLIFHEKDDLQFAGDRSAAVAHLASIGLLRAEGVGVFVIYTKEEQLNVTYFGENRLIDVRAVKLNGIPPHYNERIVPLGTFEFTKMGLELSKIAGAESLTDFWEKVAPLWLKRGVVLLR
jgi:hypothetical protein